jgi:hypothetical protein
MSRTHGQILTLIVAVSCALPPGHPENKTGPLPVGRVWEGRFGHGGGAITALAFSPDGRHIAVSPSHGVAMIRKTVTAEVVTLCRYQEMATEGPASMRFSPDGKTLIS